MYNNINFKSLFHIRCDIFQIGIIGGSGLSNPEILKGAQEKEVDTPYGKVSMFFTCMFVQVPAFTREG